MIDLLYCDSSIPLPRKVMDKKQVPLRYNSCLGRLIAAAGASPGSPAPVSGEDQAGDGTLAFAQGGVVSTMPSSWASVLIALAARARAGPAAATAS
jgi:hypothetical protein